jgi:hypothetical protein
MWMQQFRDFLRRFTGMAACSHCIDQFCVKLGVLRFQRFWDREIHRLLLSIAPAIPTSGAILIACKSGTGFAADQYFEEDMADRPIPEALCVSLV